MNIFNLLFLFILIFWNVSSLLAKDSLCSMLREFAVLLAPSMTDRLWIATRIYASVTSRFACWSSLDSTYDFDQATLKLFAHFHNVHTSFYTHRWWMRFGVRRFLNADEII